MNAKKEIMQYIAMPLWTVFAGMAVMLLGLILEPMLALLGGVLLLAALVDVLPVNSRAQKYVSRLEQAGQLPNVARELQSDRKKVIGKNRAVQTSHYLLCRGTGVVIPLDRIAWVYRRQVKKTLLFIPIRTFDALMLADGAGAPFAAINMGGKDTAGDLDALIQEIRSRNSRVRVGYTPENIAAYKPQRRRPR